MNRIIERFVRIFDYVASFALAGTVVYIGYMNYWQDLNSALLIILLVLGGLASSAICCAFHELGHVVFGWGCGFRFNSIRIGFLTIYRSEGKICCTVQRMPESLAGSVEMLPKTSEKLYTKFLTMISGGLLFSFLFLVGAAVAFIFYEKLPFAVYALLCTSLPYAFHLFFYNVLPFNDDNMDTDGSMFKGLLKKETSYLTAVNILAIEGYLYQGCSPSEIDKNLYFGLPQLPEDDLNFILLTDYRLAFYLDSEDYGNALKASDRLENLLEYVPKFYYNAVLADIIFCKSFLKADLEGALRLYPQAQLYLKGEKSLKSCRISAAYELYARQDKMAALRAVSEAEKKVETCDIKGIKKYEKKLITVIRNDIVSEQVVEEG